MGELTENKGFVVNDDGTIARDTKSIMLSMDKEILETLDVSSYSHKVLAAYKARNIAFEMCKAQYKKSNYEDYVEKLMRINCPIEWEKAEIGRKYRITTRLLMFMPWFFMIFVPIMVSLKKKHKRLCKKVNADN